MRQYTLKMMASFENVVAQIMTALSQRGFQVIRSFDLAGTLDPDDPACSCPHHGTDRCTCQYTVLLVYQSAPASGEGEWVPYTVTIHARGGEAYVNLTRLDPESASVPEEWDQEKQLLQVLLSTSVSLLPQA